MNLKSLFAKLNETSRTATESAAALCLSEHHYEVEVEHLLLQLLDNNDSDLAPILRHYQVVAERLQAQLVTALGTFKKGNTRTPALSPHITRMIEQAWLLASIEYGVGQVRSAHLLQALLDDAELRRVVIASAPELEKINADDLRLNLAALVEGSAESRQASPLASPAAPVSTSSKASGKTPALDQYTVNLTQSAREGRIDPVLGREFEVRQMVDILTRRRSRTTRSSRAKPGSAKPPWSKAWRCASPRVTCRRCSRTLPCTPSTWACYRPAPGSRASSRTASRL